MDGKLLLEELVGKKVLINTHLGAGTKDDMDAGDYKGTFLSYDGNFIKLEYDVKNFVNNATVISKAIVMINSAYIITIKEYEDKPGSLFG